VSGGLVVCSLSSSSSLSFPLCVGVRGSARAALRARTLSPNTIVFPVVFSSLFTSRLSSLPVFLFVEWRWGFTMCHCVVLA